MDAAEYMLRTGVFLLLFIGLLALEWWAPRRRLSMTRRSRWPANLGLAIVNRGLLIPLSAVAVADWAGANGWGLFNVVSAPGPIVFLLTLMLLDLTIYWQHRVLHIVPWLWRVHRAHHADADFDVTTGVRFHPIEALVSMAIKILAVAAIGAPAAAILAFEILLSATSLFNHTNVRLPAGLDRRLRLVLVTPDMHRVHHSQRHDEMNRNFGFNLPWWDHLFGSYRQAPARGHEDMRIGVEGYGSKDAQRFVALLKHPF